MFIIIPSCFSHAITNHNMLTQFLPLCAKLLQLCLTLCDPMGGNPLGSSVPGNSLGKNAEWVAIQGSLLQGIFPT